MSKIGESCAIFKDIMGMYTTEEKALAIHDVMEMPTHNGFTKAEMLKVIKWLWHEKFRLDDKPMTNAERIRNMDDKELAEFLLKVNRTIPNCMFVDCKYDDELEGNCENCFLEWLQAEVSEDV